MTWSQFLNSNLLLAIATIFTALVAYLIYLRQKADYKRNVAKLILQEIRYAERQIKIARERNNVFLLTNKLLPTNNWYDNIHLFVNNLEETDRDSISDFYSKVSFLDKVINKISEFKVSQLIPRNVPSPTQTPIPIQEIQLSAEIILKEVVDKVELLYNTSAATELRKLSGRKWYQII